MRGRLKLWAWCRPLKERARMVFRSHLVLRRYYKEWLLLHEPLENKEKNNLYIYNTHRINDKLYWDGIIAYYWDTVSAVMNQP